MAGSRRADRMRAELARTELARTEAAIVEAARRAGMPGDRIEASLAPGGTP